MRGKKFRHGLDFVMYGVALVAPLVLLPQVLFIFVNKSVAGLFLPTWYISALFNLLWISYALIHRATPLIITNILFFALNVAATIGIVLYN